MLGPPGHRAPTWHHSPEHRFVPKTAYIVTAGTYGKELYFNTPERLDYLQAILFEQCETFEWRLQAWAVMANHYHFVALSPDDPKTLKRMIARIHSKTAVWLNRGDAQPGRKVWYQYRDTCLTYENSYLARLNYVHRNPVKHGLVQNSEAYPWCSMGWFVRRADSAFRNRILNMKIDSVSVWDDF